MQLPLSEPKRPADFVLSCSAEHTGDLAEDRKCWFVRKLKGQGRDDCMLVEIHPPIIGQPFGLGGDDIFFVVLSPRWKKYSLSPLDRWPCPVYVYRILDKQVLEAHALEGNQVEVMAWGNIYPNLADAKQVRSKT